MAKKFLKQYEILLKKAKAEKLIKSLLDFNQIKFPYNHNIKEIINLANDNQIIIADKIELSQLTQYAVEGRYAIIHDDLDDTGKYIKILDNLLEFVENNIIA